jgi:hypothetical protein
MLGGAKTWFTATVLGLCVATAGAFAKPLPLPELGAGASAAVRAVVRHVAQHADSQGRPWAVVDKQNARLYVFSAEGRLVGVTPALLGLAKGDDSAPGVGAKAVSFIPPHERTTPAGRFVSNPGRNLKGEAIVWVDYEAAVAIHRLRPTDPAERRPQRLESATADDNRISLGCVVISGAFYDTVVAPVLGRSQAVVYVIPETRSWQTIFNAPAAAAEAL